MSLPISIYHPRALQQSERSTPSSHHSPNNLDRVRRRWSLHVILDNARLRIHDA